MISMTGLLALALASTVAVHSDIHPRWTEKKATDWYSKQPWLVGCNFIPSTAINQLEMWQADTFDLPTIDRELGFAEHTGMNTARVFLHSLAWKQDPKGFKHRVDQFLTTAEKHHIKPMLVLFDSCWNPEPKMGPQPKTRPGVHNCGWLQCPGPKAEKDSSEWPELKEYAQDVVRSFKRDRRILLWDIYNEPRKEALPLLTEVYRWVQEVNPSQPISSGAFGGDAGITELQLHASDVTTCHHYGVATDLAKYLEDLAKLNRPIICTEWMARPIGSKVETNLPVFHYNHVGCIIWGLVYGKTQTIYPWGSEPGSPEPKLWFHDLYRPDGTPFNPDEIKLFQNLTERPKTQ